MSGIELNSDIERQQTDLSRTFKQVLLQDSLHDNANVRVAYPNQRIDHVFEDHFRTTKMYGAAEKDGLMLTAIQCLEFSKEPGLAKQFKADAFELSATLLWETAFMEAVESHNSPATVDDRIELIDIGSSFLKHASSLTQKEDMEKTQRILLRSLFSQAMRDIVAGEVTAATRDELLLSLQDAKSQLKFIKNARYENGLRSEIFALEALWQEYHQMGDKVALPASVRGGSGHFRQDETHDIDILRQRRDESWIVLTPIEIKGRQITEAMKQRYRKSHLGRVAADGTMTISGSHRQVTL